MTGELRSNSNMEESMKNSNPYWHRNLSTYDRQTVDAVAQWLRPVPWQWFVTATFSGNIRAETAAGKLRAFANVCCVAGQESKPCLHGVRVPWHFHLLLTSHARIPQEAIEAIWRGLVGCGSAKGQNQGNVLVTPYAAHSLGPEYCLKAMNDTYGDWHLHRLENFLSNLPGPSKPNHRILRSARRAKQQTDDPLSVTHAAPPSKIR
jgi:hypothetical protein